MKGTIRALLVAAVAGLLAVGHTALAHESTPHVQDSKTVQDCGFIVTEVSRSDYLICDDMEGFFADDTNKSKFRHDILNCPTITDNTGKRPTAEDLRGDGIDSWWNDAKGWMFNTCRPAVAERRKHLEDSVGALCRSALRKAKSPTDGCEAQGKKVRILYHQHREQIPCDWVIIEVADTIWTDIHVSVDCE